MMLSVESLAPLYKILCILLLLVIPLIPAWIIYRIAPKDPISANGSYMGLTINAGGAAAMYILLFIATFAEMGTILKSIDMNVTNAYLTENRNLLATIAELKTNRPWKINCQLTLKDTNNREIKPTQYYSILMPDSIHESPTPVHIDAGNKLISFYVDNEFINKDSLNWNLILNQFGTSSLVVNRNNMDTAKKLITINQVLFTTSTGTRSKTALAVQPALESNSGLTHIPLN